MTRNRTIPDSEIDAPDPNALLSGTSTGVADYVSPRLYELTNHLGNVTIIFSEELDSYNNLYRRSGDPYFFTAPTIRRYREYTPFGLDIEQTANSPYNTTGSYRYGFNGKESDENNEFGAATHYDYGFRVYNPAIARFLSVDPLAPDYPWYTPYQFAGNNPVKFIDLDGLEPADPGTEDGQVETAEDCSTGICTNWIWYGDRAGWLAEGGTQEVELIYTENMGALKELASENGSIESTQIEVTGPDGNIIIGSGLALYGASEGIANSIPDYRIITEAMENNVFLSRDFNPLGELREYKLDENGRAKFRGNASYSAADVTRAAKRFQAKTMVVKVVKAGGVIVNIAGVALTVHDIYREGSVTLESGADLGAGFIAFVPGFGWIVATTYFVGKQFYKSLDSESESSTRFFNFGASGVNSSYSRFGE